MHNIDVQNVQNLLEQNNFYVVELNILLYITIFNIQRSKLVNV